MAISKEIINGLIKTIQNLYLSDDIPWMIGYSGGKDSTAALQLAWIAIEAWPTARSSYPTITKKERKFSHPSRMSS